MSGVWQGWFNPLEVLSEVYIIARSGSQISAICDTTVNGGEPCGWSYVSGTVNGNIVYMNNGWAPLTGVLSADERTIVWENNSTWAMAPGNVFPTPIRKVHVVFMNHLDVGM